MGAYNISQHRRKIDSIDKQICELLTKRMDVIKKVREIKQQYVKTGSSIRPARAIEVIANACKNLSIIYPKQAIINIWRNFISTSEYHEQTFSIIALNKHCSWLGREFFSDFIENHIEPDIEKLINYLNKHESHFGFLPFPNQNDNIKWWPYLIKSDINVFAIAPLYTGYNEPVLVIGQPILEPTTENDFTLVATQDLTTINQDYKLIDTIEAKTEDCKDLHLIQLPGFFDNRQLTTLDSHLIGTYSIIN